MEQRIEQIDYCAFDQLFLRIEMHLGLQGEEADIYAYTSNLKPLGQVGARNPFFLRMGLNAIIKER